MLITHLQNIDDMLQGIFKEYAEKLNITMIIVNPTNYYKVIIPDDCLFNYFQKNKDNIQINGKTLLFITDSKEQFNFYKYLVKKQLLNVQNLEHLLHLNKDKPEVEKCA